MGKDTSLFDLETEVDTVLVQQVFFFQNGALQFALNILGGRHA